LNLKHVNGVADTFGPTIQLGTEETYFPTCYHCYRREVANAHQSPVPEWSKEHVRTYEHRQQQKHDKGSNSHSTSSMKASSSKVANDNDKE
jgi:hypothetical protein